MKVKIFIVIALLSYAGTSWAQVKQGTDATASKAKKPAPAEKPKTDLDSFFKDAEDQTRKAQESGCVPKPRDETPIEPVS